METAPSARWVAAMPSFAGAKPRGSRRPGIVTCAAIWTAAAAAAEAFQHQAGRQLAVQKHHGPIKALSLGSITTTSAAREGVASKMARAVLGHLVELCLASPRNLFGEGGNAARVSPVEERLWSDLINSRTRTDPSITRVRADEAASTAYRPGWTWTDGRTTTPAAKNREAAGRPQG